MNPASRRMEDVSQLRAFWKRWVLYWDHDWKTIKWAYCSHCCSVLYFIFHRSFQDSVLYFISNTTTSVACTNSRQKRYQFLVLDFLCDKYFSFSITVYYNMFVLTDNFWIGCALKLHKSIQNLYNYHWYDDFSLSHNSMWDQRMLLCKFSLLSVFNYKCEFQKQLDSK